MAKVMVFIAEQNKNYMFRPISAIIRCSQLLCYRVLYKCLRLFNKEVVKT